MPWKECKPMDERLRFIARLLKGEKMAPLCREFGISRFCCSSTTSRNIPIRTSLIRAQRYPLVQ